MGWAVNRIEEDYDRITRLALEFRCSDWRGSSEQLVIGLRGDRRELHIVHPKRALDHRIARNPHYLDRDQPCFRSRREMSQQFRQPLVLSRSSVLAST